MRRVAVTGMGVVSPVGTGLDAFWKSLCEGKYGIGPLTRLDVSAFDARQGGEAKDFRCPESLLEGGAGMDLATRFVMVAAHEALNQAGLDAGALEGSSAGVVLATNFGGAESWEKALWDEGMTPEAAGRAFSEFSFQQAADHVARFWGMTGPRVALSLSCASGTGAIGYGLDLIRTGRADVVVAGGYDALTRFCWAGLTALRTMTKDKIRPFDRTRAGTLFSEGAGVLVLEEMGHAQGRGAQPAAEVLGHGMNNNAFHMTASDKEGGGLRQVMEMALRDAGVRPEEVDHVNAHGTGTKQNDVSETHAIKAVLGPRAREIPINSIKSMIGHTMGAAGSLEAIASILSLRDGIVPPTINLENPDPECDLDYTPNRAVRRDLRTVISNSAGIGGCNAAVVFRKVG